MVKRSIDQKLRLRSIDARHGRIESGAVIKSRKGLSGVDGGKGICYQFARRPLQFPHGAFLDHADLFSFTLRNDDVQEFETRWDEILLAVTKIPPDDILESLYTLRIRESDQLQSVFELYDMEIHQKISRPDYQMLKTLVKKSIDQKLRLRNFDARN